jgi:hypothetical protein
MPAEVHGVPATNIAELARRLGADDAPSSAASLPFGLFELTNK